MKRRAEIKEFRDLTEAQISAKIVALRKEIIEHRQNKTLGKVKNTSEARDFRRRLARLLTILNEKVEKRILENKT